MAESYVQVPTDADGKRVDALETTNSSGTTVERIRVDVPDEIKVSGALLELLLTERQMTNRILAQAFGLGRLLDDPGEPRL